jgi:hypothetical protein
MNPLGIGVKRAWLIRSLVRFSILCFMLCISGGHELAVAVGCQVVGNVSYTADTTHSYTPQFQGDRAAFFRVTRAIGVGTPDQVNLTFDRGGSLRAPDVSVAASMVSKYAALELSAQLVIDHRFYELHHLVPGNGPSDVDVSVDFTLNGQHIDSAHWRIAGINSPDLIQRSWSDCVEVPTSLLLFAVRPEPPNYEKFLHRYCVPQQGEANCPGINEVEARYTINVHQQLADLGIVGFFTPLDLGGMIPIGMPFWVLDMEDPTVGITVLGFAGRISFDAADPIILLTGCCGEDDGFWRTPTNYLEQGWSPSVITYTDRTGEGPFTGTIASGGMQAGQQIVKYAKQFGADWVNLVAHSKGGLNARWVLGQTGWLESQGVGVDSLITLDTPHEGSVGADYVMEAYNSSALPGPELSWLVKKAIADRVANEAAFHTMQDMTKSKAREFNRLYPRPPYNMTVHGVTKTLDLWGLISDANADGSMNGTDVRDASGNYIYYARRTISNAESDAWPGGLAAAWVLEGMYNLLGTATGVYVEFHPVLITDRQGRQHLVNRIRLTKSTSGFFLNDGVVTTDSQAYASFNNAVQPPFRKVFTPFLKDGAPRAVNDDNHNSLANTGVGTRILDLTRPPQAQ